MNQTELLDANYCAASQIVKFLGLLYCFLIDPTFYAGVKRKKEKRNFRFVVKYMVMSFLFLCLWFICFLFLFCVTCQDFWAISIHWLSFDNKFGRSIKLSTLKWFGFNFEVNCSWCLPQRCLLISEIQYIYMGEMLISCKYQSVVFGFKVKLFMAFILMPIGHGWEITLRRHIT